MRLYICHVTRWSGIFLSTFLQPVNSSKNSVPSCVFFLLCLWNTLERFFILFFYYSYSLVYILTNMHKGKLLVSFYPTVLQNFPWNSKISRKIQEQCIFQQSVDLSFKKFPFNVQHGATPWSHWTKQTVKKLNLWGNTAVD